MINKRIGGKDIKGKSYDANANKRNGGKYIKKKDINHIVIQRMEMKEKKAIKQTLTKEKKETR